MMTLPSASHQRLRDRKRQQRPFAGRAPGWDLTIGGRWDPRTGVEGGLTAPQVFFALGHQERVTHVTVVEVLKQQPLGEEVKYQGPGIFPHQLVVVVRGDHRPEKMPTITGGHRSSRASVTTGKSETVSDSRGRGSEH